MQYPDEWNMDRAKLITFYVCFDRPQIKRPSLLLRISFVLGVPNANLPESLHCKGTCIFLKLKRGRRNAPIAIFGHSSKQHKPCQLTLTFLITYRQYSSCEFLHLVSNKRCLWIEASESYVRTFYASPSLTKTITFSLNQPVGNSLWERFTRRIHTENSTINLIC